MQQHDSGRRPGLEVDQSDDMIKAAAVVYLHRRVALRHVDAYQIHFMTYLEWADEAYAALLRRLGTSFADMEARGVITPVVRVSCDYTAPSQVDDDLVVTSHVLGVGRTSFQIEHHVTRDDEAIARVVLTHVAMGATSRRPVQVPTWITRHARHSRPSTP